MKQCTRYLFHFLILSPSIWIQHLFQVGNLIKLKEQEYLWILVVAHHNELRFLKNEQGSGIVDEKVQSHYHIPD